MPSARTIARPALAALACSLLLGVTACGSSDDDSSATSSATPTTSASSTPSPSMVTVPSAAASALGVSPGATATIEPAPTDVATDAPASSESPGSAALEALVKDAVAGLGDQASASTSAAPVAAYQTVTDPNGTFTFEAPATWGRVSFQNDAMVAADPATVLTTLRSFVDVHYQRTTLRSLVIALANQAENCSDVKQFSDFSDPRFPGAQTRLATGCGTSQSVVVDVVLDDGNGSALLEATISTPADAAVMAHALDTLTFTS